MRVTDNLALGIKLLRRGKIVLLRVNEVTSLHVRNGHLDGKGLVRGDVLHIHRELELSRWHGGGRRDLTHRRRVARPCFDLLTVCDRQVGDRSTEVYEVI